MQSVFEYFLFHKKISKNDDYPSWYRTSRFDGNYNSRASKAAQKRERINLSGD